MSVYCFSVESDLSPSSLPRVLEVVAAHGLVPDTCHCVAGRDYLTVDLQLSGLDDEGARLIAKRFGRSVEVASVLYSRKTTAVAA